MKRTALTLALIATVAVACVALAGEGKHEKCTASTQECLDQMRAKLEARGWLGIEADWGKDATKVTRVIPGGPAEAAGLKAGDVLVAINGVALAEENKEKLYAVKKGMVPGAEVTYTVKRAGAKQQVAVTLSHMPEEVIAQWIGEHMLQDHAGTQIAAAH